MFEFKEALSDATLLKIVVNNLRITADLHLKLSITGVIIVCLQ